MRLIDADALKELFPDNGEGSWTYNRTARMYIDNAPTVEERPNHFMNNGGIDTVTDFVRYKQDERSRSMTINEESFKAWEQDHIEFLTSREMGEWLHRRDINAKRAERPTGEWIQKCDDNFDWYECSCCGYGNEGELQERPWYKYCPVCGATMKGANNEIN